MSTTHTRDDIASAHLLVGLEVHIELATRTKMFSRVASPAHPEVPESAPNTLVDAVVAALPGTLPLLNERAVEMSITVGLALGCSIATHSKWDRKNYAYPDLPKGYQLSQYDLPLCFDGALDIPSQSGTSDDTRRIGIIRAHLEEDTGKLSHDMPGGGRSAGSLLDLNRAGTPLLEIVTEPDFDCAEDVVRFGRELRSICRFLGVTEGNMQRGHMRFEPNINVIITMHDGHQVRTPIVEVKNLNSFRALEGAIRFEHARQVDAFLETGEVMGMGMKRTRGWDDEHLKTVLQREKEDAHDYRYFPEPDLLPVEPDPAWVEKLAGNLPELPMARRQRYEDELGLNSNDALSLCEEREFCQFFEEAVEGLLEHGVAPARAGEESAKLMQNQLARRANEAGVQLHATGVSGAQLGEVVRLRLEGSILSQSIDRLFELLAESDEPALSLAEAHGLIAVCDDGAIGRWISEAIAAEPKAAADVAAGKNAAVGRLVGHVMQASKGQADASVVSERILDILQSE
jgi:aspartyl-tRNA(Asn)/glutamyl-tRNA(Gln) amidotransferase subunit B